MQFTNPAVGILLCCTQTARETAVQPMGKYGLIVSQVFS